ncbi:MAG TPA: hypothetical protein PLE48_06435 [Thiobacillus sp.]|nr:MAG: hypothetical protein B7Y50_04075 [Hydrogenophilales bacterium 28-61-11]OYZ56968.1 MAG: hypothetical protein B7Y21_09590 [Hydrogenophilales bacterium 16-61-112]OZA41190.1 MAG: hypothetical protein B7X81_14370 [Hydrogenophilales bacterium 17-61-76]HQT30667.1 hypothetical protein [Thiobacillus sp.]HQT70041.1 hypothetical protein [Thiobacillus sp.]
MLNIPPGERLTSAILGGLFGAFIGLALAWLLGVFSQTLGVGKLHPDVATWLGLGALAFALLGLLFGRHLGTFVGNVLNALFQFEDARNYEFLNGIFWIMLAVLLIGGWLLLSP